MAVIKLYIINNENLDENHIKNLLINYYFIIMTILLFILFLETKFNDINEEKDFL